MRAAWQAGLKGTCQVPRSQDHRGHLMKTPDSGLGSQYLLAVRAGWVVHGPPGHKLKQETKSSVSHLHKPM